jgi:hypothetical protein
VERDSDRSIASQFVKTDHAPRLIRQMKQWQRFANLWGGLPGTTLLQPRY